MKGDPEIVAVLNKLLSLELAASHQYLAQSHMCRHWGLVKLADKQLEESAEETTHAQRLINQILFLEDLPEMDRAPLNLGSTVPAHLENDLNFEKKVHAAYKVAIKACIEKNDAVTRQILETIQAQTEEHILWLETQQHLIEITGLQNFLSDWR